MYFILNIQSLFCVYLCHSHFSLVFVCLYSEGMHFVNIYVHNVFCEPSEHNIYSIIAIMDRASNFAFSNPACMHTCLHIVMISYRKTEIDSEIGRHIAR
jgi:hypothetical protein